MCTLNVQRVVGRGWSDPDGRLSEEEAKEDEEFSSWVGRAWSDMYEGGR